MSTGRPYARVEVVEIMTLLPIEEALSTLIGKVGEWEPEFDYELMQQIYEDGERKFQIVRAWVDLTYDEEQFPRGYVLVDTVPVVDEQREPVQKLVDYATSLGLDSIDLSWLEDYIKELQAVTDEQRELEREVESVTDTQQESFGALEDYIRELQAGAVDLPPVKHTSLPCSHCQSRHPGYACSPSVLYSPHTLYPTANKGEWLYQCEGCGHLGRCYDR